MELKILAVVVARKFARPGGLHVIKAEIAGIAPFFIVKNVPAAIVFYRDRLGFDITFQGPSDDTFSSALSSAVRR